MSKSDQERFGVRIGVDYPNPPKSQFRGGGGGGGGGRGAPRVDRTPSQARAMGGKGRGGGGRARGGGRKRVQNTY